MELPGKVIGCYSEEDGEEVCEGCRGIYYGSDICKEAREDDDYQLIHARSDTEQVTVFMVSCGGVIVKLLVLDTPELADEHTTRFLEDYGYSDIDEYALDEMTGHPKTTFKVYTREIQFEVE